MLSSPVFSSSWMRASGTTSDSSASGAVGGSTCALIGRQLPLMRIITGEWAER
ncbi:hypothetical protein D9M68_559080 [compost metagenome]